MLTARGAFASAEGFVAPAIARLAVALASRTAAEASSLPTVPIKRPAAESPRQPAATLRSLVSGNRRLDSAPSRGGTAPIAARELGRLRGPHNAPIAGTGSDTPTDAAAPRLRRTSGHAGPAPVRRRHDKVRPQLVALARKSHAGLLEGGLEHGHLPVLRAYRSCCAARFPRRRGGRAQRPLRHRWLRLAARDPSSGGRVRA